ncbi:MAG: hypothetical protein ACREFF_05355 [Candidatus Udaeobacter sp.]
MMNAIAAHKNELETLLVNLSHDTAASGMDFAAALNAYISRLDTNCADIPRTHLFGAGANNRRTHMEPTLTQNCALYYAQHTIPKRRAALFQKFRAAARRRVSFTQRQLTRVELSKRRQP